MEASAGTGWCHGGCVAFGPVLHRYSAGRARPLVERLAEAMAEAPPDPLSPEWLATPSEGMRRWVVLELAARLGSSAPGWADGVCANVEPAFPGTLRAAVLAADGSDWRTDPWAPNRLAWTVLEVLSDESTAPALGVPLAPDASRYATARQIADHFDHYHVHRPAMVRSWVEGHEVDGLGQPLVADAVWQPRLWRAVRGRIDQPSAPERWPELLGRLRAGGLELDLPERLFFFGFSLLPSGNFLELLAAVAATRAVHLFLLEPSAYDRHTVLAAAPPPLGGEEGHLRPRAEGDVSSVARHPLLRSWGRSQRETVVLLADAEQRGLSPAADACPDAGPSPSDTLLGRLQAEVRANRAPEPSLRPADGDRTIQLHACYGPARQVAALGDALRHQLADHPDLCEEDIVVLCPALDRFAPLVEAVLGPSAPAASSPGDVVTPVPSPVGSPPLRYRIVDQSVHNGNEAVEATLALLELVSGRFEAPAVVDFLARPPVRSALGFDEEDLADIDRWVVGTCVRWGLDPEHRARFGLSPSVTSNTWQAALDRLLVGSTVEVDDLAVAMGGLAPYAAEAGAVACMGRLAEALRVLGALAAATTEPRALAEWTALLAAAVRLLLAVPAETAWQLEAVQRALAEVLEAAGHVGRTFPLTWGEVRRVLAEYLRGHRGRNDFFRGGITITSLVPLRDVPFRVVCLLGMDQPALTGGNPSGDDLVQAQPVLGDGDARSDLRQALLAAVLAAEDQLLVFRDGHNPRTNQPVPRAVALDELVESVLASVDPPRRGEVDRRLEIDHPCHPFAEACFTEGGLLDGTRWSFGHGDLEGARARRRRVPDRPPFVADRLPPEELAVVQLADLHAFLADPTGAFLSQRLGIRLPRRSDRPETVLPVDLDGLSNWQVGDRLLRARLEGRTVEEWAAYERGLGTLPPGTLGDRHAEELAEQVNALVERAAGLGLVGGRAPTESVDLELPDGTRVVGAVPVALAAGGPGAALVTYSSSKPGHQLRAWLDLMVLSLARPDLHWRSVVVARKGKEATAADYMLAPLADDPPSPEECVSLAVDLYRKGMDEPLPIFPRLSERLTRQPESNLDAVWRSSPSSPVPGEGESDAVLLVYGQCDVDAVLALPARPGDPGRPAERSRAKRLGRALYCAVLASMRDRLQKPAKGRPASARAGRTRKTA